MGSSTWELFSQSNSHHASRDASLFSTSLPVFAHGKLNDNKLNHGIHLESKICLENDENHAVEILLPDEDELLAGMVDDLVDDSEEYDLFGSGGGLELETDLQENLINGVSNLSLSDGGVSNGGTRFNCTSGVGGEHPLGEHPSRTLFVRNINSNVEEAEIKTLFEQYGDIRTLYTSCKHRGFVMISYYDIRDARNAMRALQNKPLRRRKLDIHFSIPKENPSDKDINQGTLVVFNLDPSVSNDDLRQIFGAYGEVKEIRETPHKRHHKFIEFYDVRAAEAALKSLNRCDIAGKRIKLEHSRPGGARRSSLVHAHNDLEQDERNLHHVGSLGNSPPGAWPQLDSLMERNPLNNFSKSPVFGSSSPPVGSSSIPGLASVLNQKAVPTGKDTPISRYLENIFANGNLNSRGQGVFEQPRSFAEQIPSSQFSGPGLVSSFGSSRFKGPTSKPFSGLFWRNNGFNSLNHHFHVGSAPSGVRLEQKFGYFQESPKASSMGPGYEGLSDCIFGRNPMENGSPVFGLSSARLSPMFLGQMTSNLESSSAERRSKPFEIKGVQLDNNKRFQIHLDKIGSGEDTRTTLMIKNIPNKYTSKMLMAAIDERHRGTYDFLYLPIDFKNKCNMGYAFINMLSPSIIIPFYEDFNGKRWEKFNSEKVASLAFARIQGKAALVAHFQNSSLMNEDRRCRPILFDSELTEFNNKMIQENLHAYSMSSQPRQSNGLDHIIPSGPTLQNVSDDQADEI
ncbi:hypothetical protein OROGR_000993 [Orobanche gracilis]